MQACILKKKIGSSLYRDVWAQFWHHQSKFTTPPPPNRGAAPTDNDIHRGGLSPCLDGWAYKTEKKKIIFILELLHGGLISSEGLSVERCPACMPLIHRFKMKVGSDLQDDKRRAQILRQTMEPEHLLVSMCIKVTLCITVYS